MRLWTAILLALSCASLSRAADPVAILVPGTLNSFVPGGADDAELRAYPYFSKAVVDSVRARGFETHVVRGLAPTGRLEANGRQVLDDAQAWYFSRHPRADAPITLLGHSAGGLYALFAAANHGRLPIDKVILVSTPLEGARLADFVMRGGPAAQKLWDALLTYRPYLDLSGLKEMRQAEVARFLSVLRFEPNLKVYAVGGAQPIARGPLEASNPDFLSPPLELTGRAIAVESDGIVDTASAYGAGARLLTTTGEPVEIVRLREERAALDHPEQFMDYRLQGFLGTRSAWIIEGRQRGFYSRLLRAAR